MKSLRFHRKKYLKNMDSGKLSCRGKWLSSQRKAEGLPTRSYKRNVGYGPPSHASDGRNPGIFQCHCNKSIEADVFSSAFIVQ